MSTPAFDLLSCPLDRLQMVEASAGTGKTWTLCGLYLRLLLERGLEVQRILVVTFTNAASAELRDRIRSRLFDTLTHLRRPAGPTDDAFTRTLIQHLLRTSSTPPQQTADTLIKRLELALASFDEAAIFTIHGFCRRALADIPFSARMPVAMELVHDDSAWCTQVAADYWRQHLGPGSAPTALLLDALTRKKDTPESLARYLKRHVSLPLTTVLWPPHLEDSPHVDLRAAQATLEQAQRLWQAHRQAVLVGLVNAIEVGRALKRNIYKLESLEESARQWDRLLACPTVLQAHAVASASDKLALLALDKMRASKTKEGQLPTHDFHAVAQEVLAHFESLRSTQTLLRLKFLRDFLAQSLPALRTLKHASHVAAFDDLLSNLHERLGANAQAEGLVQSLRHRFPAALIDEFQDTDPLQWSIFEKLYGRMAMPVFLVGDPKQAIYSFRNADLHTYMQARQYSVERHALVHNQRSTPALIGALNSLFQTHPQAFMMEGLDYVAVSAGSRERPALVDPDGPARPLQWWQLPPDPQSGEPLNKAQAEAVAAHATAQEIARLLQGGQEGRVTLGDRGLQGHDVAVLVRSHREGSRIREALSQVGVSSVELARASIFASIEAQALEAFWCAVLEPSREARLKTALSTVFWGLDAQAISALDSQDPDLALWMSKFQDLRDDWRDRGVAFMCRRWMETEAVPARLLSLDNGDRRLTNLLHLIELAHEATHDHASPDALLVWLKTQRQRALEGEDPTEESQLRLESDRNLVQIVTIHKSKGLEYPVVFCPFLWKGPTRPPGIALDGLRYHDPNGVGVIDFRLEGDPDFDPASIKAQIKLEEAAESLRLMYVALTRAIHRCVVVTGGYLSAGSPKESQRSLLHWLVAGEGHSPQSWLEHGAPLQAIDQAWQHWLQAHATHMESVPLGLAEKQATPVAWHCTSPKTFVARTAPKNRPRPWRLGSFSSLVHGVVHEGAALDHDGRTKVDTDALPPDDFLNFPRGAQAGEALHTLLESIDFAQESTWEPALDRMVASLPQPGASAERLKTQARDMLRQVLNSPLPVGTSQALQLARLDPRRRKVEMEFHLPCPRLESAALRPLMTAAGMGELALDFPALEGYLKGYIDLVFEHDGRFFVLDWKSNHLGPSAEHYAPTALSQVMQREGYHLQALLYSLAVHRWLSARWRGYDPHLHWGGVIYLFVRGVRSDWTDAQGRPSGCYFHRPSPQVLHELSALFQGAKDARGVPGRDVRASS